MSRSGRLRPVSPITSVESDGLPRCDLSEGLGGLVEYLQSGCWADGTPRETSTLLVLFEEGRWKACLNDRANARSGWVSSPTLRGALETLNEHLSEDRLEWRRRQPQRGRGGSSR